MKVFIVQNVARQVEGDLIVVQVEKGYPTRPEAEHHIANAPRQRTEMLKTDAGEIECFCVRGIYEVDVTLPSENMIAKDNAPPVEWSKPEGVNPAFATMFTPEQLIKLQNLLKSQ